MAIDIYLFYDIINKKDVTALTYGLIENSMDSLNEAVNYYSSGKEYDDERSYKFCIIMLYHSAELLMKEVLYREHPVLLYECIDNYRHNSNAGKTIGFTVALSRIKNICNIDLAHYYQYLIELSNKRNEIQHYRFDIEKEALISAIISGFSAIEHILYNILKIKLDNYEDYIPYQQFEILHKDSEVYKKRKRDIGTYITQQGIDLVKFEYDHNKKIRIPCPSCSEKFLSYQNDKINCLFCGKEYDSLSDVYSSDRSCVISYHMERELGRRKEQIPSLGECPNCNYTSMIRRPSNNQWMCASCGVTLSESDFYKLEMGQQAEAYFDLADKYMDLLIDP